MPDRIDPVSHVGVIFSPQSDCAAPVKATIQHFGLERDTVAFEPNECAGLQLLARMHQRIPPIITDMSEEQALDDAAARHAMTQQPRREHSGIVEDQQITTAKKVPDMLELSVNHRTRVARQHKKSRLTANGRWLLGDQFFG